MVTASVTVDALAALYRARYHRFVRVAEAITGDVELARDAVQDAFAKAIRDRFAFRGAGGALTAFVSL